jgi:hypothetical protein
MAQITTYATLQANVADWLVRADLTDQIKTFIQLAEARIRRVLRTKHKQTEAVALVADDGDYTVTASPVANYEFYIKTPVEFAGRLDPVTPGQIYDNRRLNYGVTGRPKLFAVLDGVLLVSPLPDTSYSAELLYEELSALSDSNATNTILTNYPDVYLYGALVASAPFLKDDPRIAVWKGLFDEGLHELEVAAQRAEYPNPVQKAPTNFGRVSKIYGR